MRAQPSVIGSVGDYELLSVIHESQTVEIFAARRRGAHGFAKPVALKRLATRWANDPEMQRRLSDEARVQGVVNHPNLVGLIDFGETREGLFLVQELVDGLSCERLLSALGRRRVRGAVGPVLYLAREMLRALDYLHTLADEDGHPLGIVHGAVSPDAILIGRSGQIKLGELGASCESSSFAGEGQSKKYRAPEQAAGAQVDARTDLHALGQVLAELLAGERFEPPLSNGAQAPTLAWLGRYLSRLPAEVTAVLVRALEPDRLRRYGNAREMARAVEQTALRLGIELSAYAMLEWLTELGILALKSGIRSSQPEQTESFAPPAPAAKTVSTPPCSFSESPTAVGKDVVYRLEVGGPLDTADILGRLATAALSPEARISRNGGPLLPIGALPELARLGTSALYRFSDPVELMATEQHQLSKEVLPQLLYSLAMERRTGLLCVREGKAQRRFFLQEGVLVASCSTSPAELLGAQLQRAGLLSEATLRQYLLQAARTGKRLGDVLTGSGVVTVATLDAFLLRQTEGRLFALASFPAGEAFFLGNVRLDASEFHSAAAPLAQVTRVLLGAYNEDHLAHTLFPIWNTPLTWSRFGRERHAELGLPPEGQEILQRCGMGESIGSLVAFDPGQAARIVKAAFVAITSQVLIPRR